MIEGVPHMTTFDWSTVEALPAPSIPALAQWAATQFGEDEAIVDGAVRLSFTQLAELALQATRAAMASGVEPGDRVAVWAPNISQYVIAALGVLGAGAWLVPLNTRFKALEAAYVLDKADVSMLFTVDEFLGTDYASMLRADAPNLRCLAQVVKLDGHGADGWEAFLARGDAVAAGAARARIDAIGPDDISDIIFTSGTTGRPKGVLLRHGPSLHAFRMWSDAFGLQRGDRYMIVNPFFHCFGYKAGWMSCLLFGATALPVAVLDPARAHELIEAERISAIPGPPTLFWSLLESGGQGAHDLSSLRIACLAAAAVPAELLRRVRTELPFEVVTVGYGLTEVHALVSMTRPDDDPEYTAHWAAGVPLPGIDVCIRDDDGDNLPAGQVGEIMVRGFNVMSGYYKDPEATAVTIESDGWLHTGDMGELSDRGDLRIVDRKKDIYICGGFNVSPAEVEAALLNVDGVSQVAVVGMPDERMGEVGAAFVVPRPGATVTADDVLTWAREHIANFKVPRRVEIVDALPVNASGKVVKGDLRVRL